MPQHKSAKKRVKTSLRRQERNRSAKGKMRTALRKYKELPDEEKKQQFPELQSKLDKASQKGIIKKRKGSRLKSRLNP
jgi:small subunit ribosomal protein S20